MSVTFSCKGDCIEAILDGDIDHHTAQDMRETIDTLITEKKPSTLNLDFSHIKFMDSSGIGLIMGRYRLMKSIGGKIHITNIPVHIEKLIKLSGLGVLGLV